MTRKPKDRLTLVKGLAIAREKGMDEICVGQALALQYWMERLELNAPQLAARRGSCPTSIYQVLKLEWAPSSPWWNVTAKALGMELWQFDMDAELLLQGKADGVLADEQQLVYVLEQTPAEQRSRLRLALKDSYRESQAFVYSPNLDNAMATRLDRAISQAKRDGLLP
jgi:hypothetical protein